MSRIATFKDKIPKNSILARIFGLRQGYKDKSCPGQDFRETRTRWHPWEGGFLFLNLFIEHYSPQIKLHCLSSLILGSFGGREWQRQEATEACQGIVWCYLWEEGRDGEEESNEDEKVWQEVRQRCQEGLLTVMWCDIHLNLCLVFQLTPLTWCQLPSVTSCWWVSKYDRDCLLWYFSWFPPRLRVSAPR